MEMGIRSRIGFFIGDPSGVMPEGKDIDARKECPSAHGFSVDDGSVMSVTGMNNRTAGPLSSDVVIRDTVRE